MKIFVKVKAGASQTKVEQLDATHYEVSVTELPVRGLANAAVLKALARYLNVAPSLLIIKRGQTTKQKTVEVNHNQPLL